MRNKNEILYYKYFNFVLRLVILFFFELIKMLIVITLMLCCIDYRK